MTNKDKVIAAFLVSVGIFSAVQAMQYVKTLSDKEKNSIAVTAKNSAERIVLCSGVGELNSPAQNPHNA